uniref:Protein lifeguard 3 n=2 Tax=Caenorhabditis tropicalis TaxID=1561998 RepID=A0A1I7UDQ1_9PELO
MDQIYVEDKPRWSTGSEDDFGITAAFSSVPIISREFRMWCHEYYWGVYVAMAVFLMFYITLMCCEGCRRSFPCNLIILTLFTLSAATMTMFVTAAYSVESVMIALLITTLCSAAIIIFAATTKKDLTSCLGIAFILGICLLLFGLMTCIFVFFMHWYFLNIVYSALGALLCMFYLAIDIQLIMGGRRVEISPEEYIFAAVHVFVDILTMFFHILGVVGRN